MALEPASLEALHALFWMDLITLTVQLETAILKTADCYIGCPFHSLVDELISRTAQNMATGNMSAVLCENHYKDSSIAKVAIGTPHLIL